MALGRSPLWSRDGELVGNFGPARHRRAKSPVKRTKLPKRYRGEARPYSPPRRRITFSRPTTGAPPGRQSRGDGGATPDLRSSRGLPIYGNPTRHAPDNAPSPPLPHTLFPTFSPPQPQRPTGAGTGARITSRLFPLGVSCLLGPFGDAYPGGGLVAPALGCGNKVLHWWVASGAVPDGRWPSWLPDLTVTLFVARPYAVRATWGWRKRSGCTYVIGQLRHGAWSFIVHISAASSSGEKYRDTGLGCTGFGDEGSIYTSIFRRIFPQ